MLGISRRRLALATGLVLPVLVLIAQLASATGVTVTPATGGSAISSDTAGGAFTSLTGPIITETAFPQISTGSITLTAPAGFEFATSAVGVAATPGSSSMTLGTACPSSARTVNITPTATSMTVHICTVSNRNTTLTFSSVKVRPVAGTPLADGSITMASTSTATITGVTPGVTSLGTLNQTPGALAAIRLSPASASIVAGGAQAYTATALDQFGNVRGDVTSSTTFTIGGVACASGTCGSTEAGEHTVTGTHAGSTATASLTVTPASLDSMVLAPLSASITAGSSQSFSAEGFDVYGNSRGDVTDAATFTVDGVACDGAACGPTTAGDYTVEASLDGVNATASLTVNPASIDTLVLSPGDAEIVAGATIEYTAEGFDPFGNSTGDVTDEVTFTIADEPCVANSCGSTVAGEHVVHGAHAVNSAGATLRVIPSVLATIEATPLSATVEAGQAQAYGVEGFDAYGNSRGDLTSEATFTIDDEPCDGNLCSSTIAGEHQVVASVDGFTAEATLTVVPSSLTSIIASPSIATITAGGSQAYTVEGFDAFGNSRGDVTGATVFTIDGDPCDGNVCSSTLAGERSVLAVHGAVSDTATLFVEAAELDSIEVTPEESTIVAGETQAYSVEGFDVYGNSHGDLTVEATFAIDGDPCDANVCSSTQAGEHVIDVAVGDVVTQALLTVLPSEVASIVVTPNAATITAGETQAFGTEAFDAYGNSLGDVTGTTSFSLAGEPCDGNSCSTTIAGEHEIVAEHAGVTDTAGLTVLPAAASELTLELDPDTVVADGVQTSLATSTVSDVYGNVRVDDVVSLETDGDASVPAIMSPVGDGSYEAMITASTTAGDETITANVGGLTATVVLHEVAGLPVSIEVTAEPDLVYASPAAANQSAIEAVVTDANGNAIEGVAVTFSITDAASGGGVDMLGPGLSAAGGTSDADGRVTIVYTAGYLPGSDEITAAAGAISAITRITVAPSVCGFVSCPAPAAAATSDVPAAPVPVAEVRPLIEVEALTTRLF